MKITYPHVIENCMGEKIYQRTAKRTRVDRLLVKTMLHPTGPVYAYTLLQADH